MAWPTSKKSVFSVSNEAMPSQPGTMFSGGGQMQGMPSLPSGGGRMSAFGGRAKQPMSPKEKVAVILKLKGRAGM